MGNIGATEIILILLVLLLLFGARKLPELARGSGRALRIFKAETKGLVDDDDEKAADEHGRQDRAIDAGRAGDPIVPPSHPTAAEQPQVNRPEHER